MIKEKIKETHIKLHQARMDESLVVLNLANDNVVRANSFHPEKISKETHEKWFSTILENPNALLLLAEVDGIFAGQVKFDISKNEATIGISISKEFRGRGLGPTLITLGIQTLFLTYPKVKKVIAYIKHDNVASIKTFEKTKFIQSKSLIYRDHPSFEYKFFKQNI